ncbi:MAG: hypothetical protein IJW24_03410 [Clostridia bacterium]|nr:hypothetical protein [Clostridia bacterium]
MKQKTKKKIQPNKAYSRKLKLNEIQELVMIIVVVKRENERFAVEVIKENRGIVLSRSRGKGLSRLSALNSIGAFVSDVSVVFGMVRVEDAEKAMDEISFKLKLEMPGNGRAMIVPIDGYMGAKAPFVEAKI